MLLPQFPPLALNDTATGWLRTLLQLPCGHKWPQRTLQPMNFLRAKAIRPKQLALFSARVFPTDAGDKRAVGFVLHGQAKVRPFAHIFLNNVPGQVIFSQSLLNNHICASLGVVQTGGHRAVPPLNRAFDVRIRKCFRRGVRVIDHDNRTTFTGHRCANRRDQALTAMVIRKAGLCVLVGVQLKAVAPQVLIPWRFNQSAALNAVAQHQLVGIGRHKELHTRP